MQIQIINFNPKKIKKISDEANNLLNGLLNKNPEKRLTCNEILNHPWLQNIDFNFLNSDNDKYNLFTEAEMILLSKTYIDYRNGNLEDLRENFTITNLKSDEIKESEKNITAKSSILDPFNSAVENNKSSVDASNEYDIYERMEFYEEIPKRARFWETESYDATRSSFYSKRLQKNTVLGIDRHGTCRYNKTMKPA